MASNDINKAIQKILDNAFAEYKDSTDKVTLELIKAYSKALEDIQNQLAKLYATIGKPDINEARKFNRLSNLEKSVAEQIKAVTKQNIPLIGSTIKSSYEFGYYMTGFALEGVTGARLGFSLLNPKSIESALNNNYTAIKWQESLTHDVSSAINATRQEITQGLIQGKSYDKVVRAIQERLVGTPKRLKGITYQVDRIVRTESHRAHSEGRLSGIDKAAQSADRLGIDIKKIWRCVLDDKTREAHAHMDGKEADKDGMFTVGGEQMQAPGLGAIAGNNINCRCDAIARVEGLPEGKRHDNMTRETLEAGTTFDDWAESKNIKMKYWKR